MRSASVAAAAASGSLSAVQALDLTSIQLRQIGVEVGQQLWRLGCGQVPCQFGLVPSLRLNLDDNDYFRARLTLATPQPEPTKPSHKLLDEAFRQAHLRVTSIVDGLDIRDQGPRLNQWVNFLEKRAEVILLKVPNAANAYRIFETLNDRGMACTRFG